MFLDMFRKKKRDASDYPLERLKNNAIAYVTSRDSTGHGETILGKGGAINIKDDELIIVCSNGIVFRRNLAELKITDLMSLNGVVIRYTDAGSNEERAIVVYFKYHRK